MCLNGQGDVRHMRTENLQYLIEISQHKTLTAAAEILNLMPHISDVKVTGILKISLSSIGSENFMPIFLSLWYKAFPSVNLEIHYQNGPELLQSVLNNEVDLALVYAVEGEKGFLTKWDSSLKYTTLYASHRYCLVPNAFQEAEKNI